MPQRFAIVLFAICISLVDSTAHAQSANPNDILIIAHNDVTVATISIDELRDFFLKKRANWSTGEKVIPINASEDSELRKAFREKVLQLNTEKEQTYWQERIIIKGEKPPASFTNTQKAVFKIRGAVSYVYRKDYRKGVSKILLVVQ